MPEITLDSLKETLDVLVDANPHARNKGDEFKAWSKDNFDCDARISHVKEQRQITNRVSEQFRYFAPIVVFVCVPEVKRDTLIKYILDRVYKELENVAIIGVTQNNGRKKYTFEQLIVFKHSPFTQWASPHFEKVDEAKDISERLGQPINMIYTSDVQFAWYVGTTGSDANGEWHDYSDEYIAQGKWVNGWDDKFIDLVKSIQIGDRIAIKSSFTQKKNLPFENYGKTVSAMRIKAIGTVTANAGDGKSISVDWTKLDPFKTWYGPGTLRETIHGVSADEGFIKKALLDFTFGNEPEDYSLCTEKYNDATDSEVGVDENAESGTISPNFIDESTRLHNGTNILLYGVPGSGKSWTIEHEYCHADSKVERLVFHPDYTNADFIGQILPVVDAEKQVTYEFTPGPFTTILDEAYWHPQCEYVLIIEEINRGNAPAIFGEVFQLLDRLVDPKTDADEGITYPVGTSEYGITNKYMSEEIYGTSSHKIRIPSNLTIVATMNTSDQNVFTLDTAFQRRWLMRLIENNFNNVRSSLADAKILDTDVTWRKFCETVNEIIIGNKSKMASAEDKRLGVYFIHENDITFDNRALPSADYATISDELDSLLKDELLEKDHPGTFSAEKRARLSEIQEAIMHNRMFPEKVIKYLWDDAFKFNPEALFDTDNVESLEQIIRMFVYSKGFERFKIFKPTVQASLHIDEQQ